VVLLPETGREPAEAALEKLRRRVKDASESAGARVTASIGAVSFPRAPLDVEALVHEADRALDAAKAAGGDALLCREAGEEEAAGGEETRG
jgi:GGDEF domain-containing protein